MSNFDTTKHHHYGSHMDHRGSGEWASSMASSLQIAGSSCSNSPGGCPNGPCCKAAEPGPSRASPSRYPSNVGLRCITGPSRTNNPFSPGHSLNDADPMSS
ncbi:hypothetical protein ACFX1T_012891 [Malus domestica]